MRKNKALIAVLSLACMSATVGAISAAADESQPVTAATANIEMVAGAGVREWTTDLTKNGIRFQGKIAKSEYEAIESENVSYGIVLIGANDLPTAFDGTIFTSGDYVWATQDADGAWVAPEWDEATSSWKDAQGNTGKKRISNFVYETLTDGANFGLDENTMVINGSLTNFKADNLTYELTARAYIAETVGDTTTYYFAEDNNNTISMTYVAQVAIASDLDTDGYFQTNYVDAVPTAYKTTSYQVKQYVENETGAYELASTITVTDAMLDATTDKTKYGTKDGYVFNAEKSTSAKIFANGKTVVEAYYDLPAPVSITATYANADDPISEKGGLDYLKQYVTVKATDEADGVKTVPAEQFTLSGTLTGGSEATLTVTYKGLTAQVAVGSEKLSTGYVADFDNAHLNATTQIPEDGWSSLSVGVSSEQAFGGTGNSMKVTANAKQHATQVPIVTDFVPANNDLLYVSYWMYFPSEEYVNLNGEATPTRATNFIPYAALRIGSTQISYKDGYKLAGGNETGQWDKWFKVICAFDVSQFTAMPDTIRFTVPYQSTESNYKKLCYYIDEITVSAKPDNFGALKAGTTDTYVLMDWKDEASGAWVVDDQNGRGWSTVDTTAGEMTYVNGIDYASFMIGLPEALDLTDVKTISVKAKQYTNNNKNITWFMDFSTVRKPKDYGADSDPNRGTDRQEIFAANANGCSVTDDGNGWYTFTIDVPTYLAYIKDALPENKLVTLSFICGGASFMTGAPSLTLGEITYTK